MQVPQAIHRDRALHIEVDGLRLFAEETKYTILELGYALYLFEGEPDTEWLRKNGESIPGDPADNRPPLRSGGDTFITSDPVMFALAYRHWWAQNSNPLPENVPLPIPTREEATEVLRTRKILNRDNA